jgi:23S rRNA pseudouridine2605 synthase
MHRRRKKHPARPAGGPPKRKHPVAARPRPPAVAPSADADQPRGERLQKVLAAAGVASRRECEELILEGRVEVDGEVVSELGARVDRARQEIKVDGEPLARPRLQYFAVHKPAGVVSTARDPAGRPRVIDLLPPGVGRMFNVGRLDLASEGLILVTNDGELANRLTHPRHGVEKVYEVQVAGAPEPDVLAQLRRGVHLAEGFVHAVDVRIKSRKKNSTLLEMVLDEGRNREIRRLLARVGHKVQRLTRIAVGPIRLGEMPRGAVRQLTREELQKLRAAAAAGRRAELTETAAEGAGRPPAPADRQRKRRAPSGKAGGPPKRFAKKKPRDAASELPERRIIGDEPPVAPARPAKFKPRHRKPARPAIGGPGPAGPGPKGPRPKGPHPKGPRRPKRSGPR